MSKRLSPFSWVMAALIGLLVPLVAREFAAWDMAAKVFGVPPLMTALALGMAAAAVMLVLGALSRSRALTIVWAALALVGAAVVIRMELIRHAFTERKVAVSADEWLGVLITYGLARVAIVIAAIIAIADGIYLALRRAKRR